MIVGGKGGKGLRGEINLLLLYETPLTVFYFLLPRKFPLFPLEWIETINTSQATLHLRSPALGTGGWPAASGTDQTKSPYHLPRCSKVLTSEREHLGFKLKRMIKVDEKRKLFSVACFRLGGTQHLSLRDLLT